MTFGDLSEIGVWSVRDPVSGQELAKIACNLFNAAESDLRSAEKLPEREDGIVLGSVPIWHWLALAALLLTLIEWFLYQRRWIE
jgi:type VI protein secretion system component VasF